MKIGLTNHAIERYQERVKPAISLVVARQELGILVEQAGEPTTERPEWHYLPEDGPRDEVANEYLTLADGIVAAVHDGVVRTIITRGSSCPAHRANKNAAKARKKRARQAQRRHVRRLKGSEPKEIWR